MKARQLLRAARNGTGRSMPPLTGATGWLNSTPLTQDDLDGKVVVVQFWTYSSANWLRTLPYVRAWAEKYAPQDLVVIGAHSPEFPFEHDVENVRRAAAGYGIQYPIALDSEFEVWEAFANHYWPALYFVDAQGHLRHGHVGEGEYIACEQMIQRLLTEAGRDDFDHELVSLNPNGVEAPADLASLTAPDTYVGYGRAEGFASPEGTAFDEPHVYTAPPRLRHNHWALIGKWLIDEQAARLKSRSGGITFRFRARDLNLVMGTENQSTPVRFYIRIDGEAPRADHGIDVDAQGDGTVTDPRLYQLLRQRGAVAERTFEITFLDGGAMAYVFTFG